MRAGRRGLIESGIVWEGASLFDGAPIVAIVTGATGGSANEKTGRILGLCLVEQAARFARRVQAREEKS